MLETFLHDLAGVSIRIATIAMCSSLPHGGREL
jgi:hypothetical protein